MREIAYGFFGLISCTSSRIIFPNTVRSAKGAFRLKKLYYTLLILSLLCFFAGCENSADADEETLYIYDAGIDAAEKYTKYFIDEAGVLSDEDINLLSTYVANWDVQKGATHSVAITFDGATDIAAMFDRAEELSILLGLGSKDSLVLIDSKTGISAMHFGDDASDFREAGITFEATGPEGIRDGIYNYYLRINEYYTSSTDLDNRDAYLDLASSVFESFTPYLSGLGLITLDVSHLNQVAYEGAQVLQASDGIVTYYILKGTCDDAEFMWGHYYSACLENENSPHFSLMWDKSDSGLRSVQGVINEEYVRADLISNVCIYACTSTEEGRSAMNTAFAGMGIPAIEGEGSP